MPQTPARCSLHTTHNPRRSPRYPGNSNPAASRAAGLRYRSGAPPPAVWRLPEGGSARTANQTQCSAPRTAPARQFLHIPAPPFQPKHFACSLLQAQASTRTPDSGTGIFPDAAAFLFPKTAANISVQFQRRPRWEFLHPVQALQASVSSFCSWKKAPAPGFPPMDFPRFRG